MLFGVGLATKIYLGIEAVDMRKGFEGLYGAVRDQLGHDPLSGHLVGVLFRQTCDWADSSLGLAKIRATIWQAKTFVEPGRFPSSLGPAG
jgi:hypothetical protein